MTADSAGAGQPRRRRALLLGCAHFTDAGLPALRSPAVDVELLADVLTRPGGSGYEILTEVNCTSGQAQVAIERFLSTAQPRDLHLVYFSGHGIQDDRGNLYFAFRNTDRELPSSTAVSADWLRNQINASRSRSTVLVLDCCYSGAYLKGMRPRAVRDVNVASLVRDLPDGSGVAVLTSSSETEFSMEEDSGDTDQARPSYFTEAIVTGIATGAADTDRDGLITVDELYSYVYRRIKAGPSRQRPKWINLGEGNLVVALAGHPGSQAAQPRPERIGRESHALERRQPDPATAQTATARTRPAQADAMTVAGVLGKLSFDGRQVTITKTRHGSPSKGSFHIPTAQLADVVMKPATRLLHGYIQFVMPGRLQAPVARFGPASGRPPYNDPLSLSFPRKANQAMADLRLRIMAAARLENTAKPPLIGSRPPPRTRQAPTTPGGQDTSSAMAGSARATASPQSGATASAELRAASAAVVDPVVADHDHGRRDGARAAGGVPLYALEGLVATQFHLEQWLQPWRDRWRLIAIGQAPPDPNLSRWLPALAGDLGSVVAAPELPQASHTPSLAYRQGFARGMAETWGRAVKAGRIPATPAALAVWLRQPLPTNQQPRLLLTLAELDRLATRARNRRIWATIGRITVWVFVFVFAIAEMIAIGVTATNSWPEHNVANAVAGNLCYGLPLLGLLTLGLVDLRRSRRSGHPVSEPPMSAHPPTENDQRDRVQTNGAACATGGGRANTGVDAVGQDRPAQVSASGDATADGPGSVVNTGVQRRPRP